MNKLILLCLAAFFTLEARPVRKTETQSQNPPLELKVTRAEQEEIDKKIPAFTFSLHYARPNQDFTLIVKDLDGREEVLHPSLKCGADGQLLDGEAPFKLCTLAMGPGEPITIIAKTKEGKETSTVQFIPRPLVSQVNDYTLSLQLADPEKKTFQLHACGYAPQEPVELVTRSGGIVIHQRLVANQKGEINSALVHQATGEYGGEAYVELQGQNGTTQLTYPWGSCYHKELREIKKVERQLIKQG